MPTALLNDDPRDGTDGHPDLLGRREYGVAVANLLRSVRSQSESSVLALIGDWGSGKTSLLQIVQAELAKASPRWFVANFNPWTYPDAASIQTGFFDELYSALPEDIGDTKLRQKIGLIAKKLSPLANVAGLFGIDGERVVQHGGELLLGDRSLSAIIRSAEEDLRALDAPVLMIMDDLDRLTPEELLVVLKLVRLIGRLPNVYYLLCYDEHTLVDVLTATPLVGQAERAHAYLEKVVQVRLDVPMLRKAERLALFNDALESFCKTHDVEITDDDAKRLSAAFEGALEERLTTPRAIYRFVGQAEALYASLRDEVDLVDFLLVSWLRTQEPGAYRMLQKQSALILGYASPPWGTKDTEAASAARLRFWEDHLEDAHVARRNYASVKDILSRLFPHFGDAFNQNRAWAHGITPRDSEPRAVANPLYFDRYMIFGVPTDDLKDATLADALAELSLGNRGPNVGALVRVLRERASLVLTKLRERRERSDNMPDFELARLLFEEAPNIVEPAEFSLDPMSRLVEREIARCLARMSLDQARDILDERLSLHDIGITASNAIRELYWDRSRGEGLLAPQDIETLPELFVEASVRLERRFKERDGRHELSGDEALMFLLWRDVDNAKATSWLSEQVKSGRWDLATAAISMVLPSQRSSGREPATYAAGVAIDTLTSTFPLPDLLEALGHRSESDLPHPALQSFVFDWEGRRKCALAELRRSMP